MAEKIDVKPILDEVTLVQAGKVVKEPEKGNYAVHPQKESVLMLMPGHEVLKLLKAAFPECVFTWFATHFEQKPAAKA